MAVACAGLPTALNQYAMPKIVRSSKNKIHLRKVVTHSLCFPSSYNLGRAASPPLHHARQCPFCHSALLTLLVTFYFLHCSPYQITLYSSFLLLYYILISWSSLVSYPLSRSLLLLQDCFHLTVAPPPLLRFDFGCRPPTPAPA